MQPTRLSAFVFCLKILYHQLRRAIKNRLESPSAGSLHAIASGDSILGESITRLWTSHDPREFALTAGKVHNLRIAAQALNGRHFAKGEVFSFWRALGRPTRSKGYRLGREIREGCVVPSLAGGICQLSNALYDAALKAGFRIVERHAHSRVIAGSLAEQGRDATVFWNYVDLQFASSESFYFDIQMTAHDLLVRV